MPLIDIDKLLSEISPDEPCGPDLEYDADFMALMSDAEGRPAKYTPDGQLVEEGEDPNWKDISDRCVGMFGRTIDLRVALVLTKALMMRAGLPGMRDGLSLIRRMLEEHWDSFHPQLDPDDGNDPLMRMNLVASFAAPIGADGDPFRFQQRLREVPLAESRQLGRFGLKDLMIASGDLPAPSGSDGPTDAVIRGAFKDTEEDALRETGAAAEAAVSVSKDIDQWLTTKVGASNAPNLNPWHAIVGDLAKRLAPILAERFPGQGVAQADAEEAEEAVAASATGGTAAAQAPAAALSGAVNSRDDVLRALNKVLDYYTRHEPSSPVPLLVKRAQRLVTMDFMDIIRELSPNAVDQIRVIGGDESAPVPSPSGTAPAAPPPAPAATPPAAKPAAKAPAKDAEPIRLGAADFRPR